ncbi:efflux transporter periplasmic adaptor subunit [Lysobacteraceae bacterium NML08-0793]|nr:efflux transporter periplasmic adaptor subunit [Xanthomonadaceae bacterium NML08-0793]
MASKTLRATALSTLIAASLMLAACNKQQAAPANAAPPPVPVSVVTLTAGNVALGRELSGRASASQTAEVRPQVTGIVERLLFSEGGSVKAGQVLYQIDQTAFRAAAGSAEASLARAQAALTTARLNAERSAELVKIDAVSRQEDETAQATLRQAQADVNAARAALQSANVPLGFTRVSAPISGRISHSSVTRGALVTAGQASALATIQQLDPMYVEVTQSSSELLQLRREIEAGQAQAAGSVPVEIVLEDGSVFPHAGQLRFAEATVDPTTGSVLLRVVVPNPEQLLLPGMYVRARLTNAERQGAILAPQQGITRDAKGNATALVVNAENKVEPREVVVSRAIGDKWLVESGLAAGDKLIVEGLQKVKPGSAVTPTEAGAAAAAAGTAKPEADSAPANAASAK